MGIFTSVVWTLPEEEDQGKGFFIFCLEVILPIALHFAILIVVLFLLLWYLIILPNLSTVHCYCYPDFIDFQERQASFPNYWEPDWIDQIFPRESTNEDEAIGSGWPTWPVQHLANEGLFFSHPRMKGLQVTCFSCGNVFTACGGQQTQTFVHLDSCCKSTA